MMMRLEIRRRSSNWSGQPSERLRPPAHCFSAKSASAPPVRYSMLAIASMIEMVCCEQEIVPGRTGWTRLCPGGRQEGGAGPPPLASGDTGRERDQILWLLV